MQLVYLHHHRRAAEKEW